MCVCVCVCVFSLVLLNAILAALTLSSEPVTPNEAQLLKGRGRRSALSTTLIITVLLLSSLREVIDGVHVVATFVASIT